MQVWGVCYAPCSCALTPAGLWLASWKLRQADAKSQHQRVLRQHKVVLEELGALRKEQAQLQEEVVEHTKEVQASEATVRSTEAAIATCSAELEADTAAYAKLKDQADRDLERKGELTEQRDELQRVLRTAKDARRRNDNEERKRDALAAMKRCITGVRGRLVDLCRPTSKRFTDAVTRVLGKHADSIVVDTQAAGFECMNVRGGRCRHVAHYPGGSRVDTLW